MEAHRRPHIQDRGLSLRRVFGGVSGLPESNEAGSPGLDRSFWATLLAAIYRGPKDHIKQKDLTFLF